MCLNINPILTKKHSSLTINKKHTFYKVFEIIDNELTTFYQNTRIKKDLEIIEQNDFFIDIDDNGGDNEINDGVLHAFVTKLNHSHLTIDITREDTIQIPITVESNDIVAFGSNNDVCFIKYKISKTSWQKIHKKIKKYRENDEYYPPTF